MKVEIRTSYPICNVCANAYGQVALLDLRNWWPSDKATCSLCHRETCFYYKLGELPFRLVAKLAVEGKLKKEES